MPRLSKILLSALITLLVIITLIGIQMHRMPADALKDKMLSFIDKHSDLDINHLGEVRWQWFPLGIEINDFDISHQAQKSSQLQAKTIQLSVKWLPLLKGTLAIKELKMDAWQFHSQPTETADGIAMLKTAAMTQNANNVSDKMAVFSKYPWMLFEKIHLSHGQLRVITEDNQTIQAKKIDVVAKQINQQLQAELLMDYYQSEQWVDWNVSLHVKPVDTAYQLSLWSKSQQENTDLYTAISLSKSQLSFSEITGRWRDQNLNGHMTIAHWQDTPTVTGHLSVAPVELAPWRFHHLNIDCYQQSPGLSQCPIELKGDYTLSSQLTLDTTTDIPHWQATLQSSDLDMAKILTPLTGMTLLTGQGQLDSQWSGQGLDIATWQGSGSLHVQDAYISRINLKNLSDLGNPNALSSLGDINSQFSFQDLIWTHHQFDCVQPDWQLKGQGSLDFSQGFDAVPMDYQWTVTGEQWPSDIVLSFKNTLQKPKVSLDYEKTLQSLLKKQIEKKLKEHVFDFDIK